VVALTLFTATLAKLREYAVAKAIGAGSAWLTRTVLAQAAWAVGVALLVAVGLAVAVAAAVGAATPSIRLAIEPASVLRTAIGALLVGGSARSCRCAASPRSILPRSSGGHDRKRRDLGAPADQDLWGG
jgi:putative ABC transport system permease protein